MTTLKISLVIAAIFAITVAFAETSKASPKIEFFVGPNGFGFYLNPDEHQREQLAHEWAYKKCAHWLKEYRRNGSRRLRDAYDRCYDFEFRSYIGEF